MSRVGRAPIDIPKGVEVRLHAGPPMAVSAKGPKGELREELAPFLKAEMKDGRILLAADHAAAREAKAFYGTARARIHNMVHGVGGGFEKVLDIIGLGFRAEVAGSKITFALGKSHPVVFEMPKGISAAVDPKKTQLTLSGADKELLGRTAAAIRTLRPPEHYKGTGIRYRGEHVRKKAGKAAAGAGAGAAKK